MTQQKKQCDCISLNRPEEWQKTPSRKMSMPCGVLNDGEKKYEDVFIDECISDDIQRLWDVGIFTQGSCCGHNGIFGKDIGKSVVISSELDYEKAREILPDFEICYWKIIRNKII